MRLPVRPITLLLITFGLAMLAIGIWVEDRDAVAVPLVVLGALIVLAGGVIETWADIEEMSVSQSGLTFKRRPPTVEELTQAGLPEQVAEEMQAWMDSLIEVLPGAIDKRVNAALAKRVKAERNLTDLARELAARQLTSTYGQVPEPPAPYGAEPKPAPKRSAKVRRPKPPEPGAGTE